MLMLPFSPSPQFYNHLMDWVCCQRHHSFYYSSSQVLKQFVYLSIYVTYFFLYKINHCSCQIGEFIQNISSDIVLSFLNSSLWPSSNNSPFFFLSLSWSLLLSSITCSFSGVKWSEVGISDNKLSLEMRKSSSSVCLQAGDKKCKRSLLLPLAFSRLLSLKLIIFL